MESPPSRSDSSHAWKQHRSFSQTTRTQQCSPSTLHELPPTVNVPRATMRHSCPAHGPKRAATSVSSVPIIPLTVATPPRELPIPPGVVRATSIGSFRATCQHKSRRSARESLEDTFYDCQENSIGFLTPSLDQSHSDPRSRDDDDPSEDRIRLLCCYLPRINLPQFRLVPCLEFLLAKDEPVIIGANSHATHANLPPRAWRKKSASVANDEAMRSVQKAKSISTIMASSTSMVQGKKLESLGRSDSTITVCRNALFSRGRRTASVSAISVKRSSKVYTRHHVELPTIVTLRRAIAVLNTLTQPSIHAFSADMNNSAILREYRRSIRSMALPTEYLITFEEIKSLKSQIQSKFIEPTPKQTALVKKRRSLVGIGRRARVKKSSSGSVVWFGAPNKNLQSRAPLPISNAQTSPGSILSHRQKGHFMSHVSQRTSIISMLMTGKGIHEMIFEDNSKAQNLFSSTWNLANSLAQADVATGSRNSHRKNPDPAPIDYSDSASYGGGTAITSVKRTFKTIWEHHSEKSSDTPYDINKSLTLSEVKIPSYVTQQFSICTPKPISDGVWLPPISTFNAPFIEIPADNLRPSVLDPGPSNSSWRENHEVTLHPKPKHPLLGSPVLNVSEKPLALMAPGIVSQSKPSAWGNSTHSLVRVPVGSRPKPSLWSSDVAASGQMTAVRRGKEPAVDNTPRLWKRASARRLRTALGMGSGESWRRVLAADDIMDAGNAMEKADDRAPWGADTLDGVSIISGDAESDRSSKMDMRSLRRKNGLRRRISQKARHARNKVVVALKDKDMEDKKAKEGGRTGSDCPSENLVYQGGTLEEKAKYEKMEEWVSGLREATPELRPRPSCNYINMYGSSRASDPKAGNDRPRKLEGGARRSVSITTIG
ncbi:hypothetical protein V490_01233 [Pseudogymnoascus sp. VKM F-3557]|nr:hypothetical protein V490_01233 [Pseudogymnoascus sp. VKM F-3557]